MNCRNFHAERQSPYCPYCVVIAMIKVLEQIDPNNHVLSVAYALIDRAQKEEHAPR